MLWILIIAVLIFAAILSPMMGINRLRELRRRYRTTAYMLCGLSCLSMALSLLALISATALLLWGGYTYLRHGAWPPFALSDILRVLDVNPWRNTGWIGVDNLVVAPIEWPGILVLIIGLPVFFHYLAKALVSAYKAYTLAGLDKVPSTKS